MPYVGAGGYIVMSRLLCPSLTHGQRTTSLSAASKNINFASHLTLDHDALIICDFHRAQLNLTKKKSKSEKPAKFL